MKTVGEFDRKLRGISAELFALVKVRARVILKKHKNLGEFFLLEGVWWFTDKKDGRMLDPDEPRFQPVAELMKVWGRALGGVCRRVHFTAEGPEKPWP